MGGGGQRRNREGAPEQCLRGPKRLCHRAWIHIFFLTVRKKQGRIHDCPCRGRLGRGSNELGRGRNDLGRGINNHRILIPELFYLQTTQKRRESKVGRTDAPTDGPTDTVTYRSRCPRQKHQRKDRKESPQLTKITRLYRVCSCW